MGSLATEIVHPAYYNLQVRAVGLLDSSSALEIMRILLRRFFFGRHVHFLGWTPLPPPRQKGYQSAPFSNRHPSAYSSRPETEVLQSYGAKTEIRMPMHT